MLVGILDGCILRRERVYLVTLLFMCDVRTLVMCCIVILPPYFLVGTLNLMLSRAQNYNASLKIRPILVIYMYV